MRGNESEIRREHPDSVQNRSISLVIVGDVFLFLDGELRRKGLSLNGAACDEKSYCPS